MRAALQALRAQGGGGAGFFRPGAGAAGGEAGGAPRIETRGAVVFVLGADSIPEPRLVQIGLGDWDNTQVVSGLEEGETLVIVGADDPSTTVEHSRIIHEAVVGSELCVLDQAAHLSNIEQADGFNSALRTFLDKH